MQNLARIKNMYYFIADKCFDGTMVFTLIIMVIILLVLIPVGIVVDKKIEAYFENKNPKPHCKPPLLQLPIFRSLRLPNK